MYIFVTVGISGGTLLAAVVLFTIIMNSLFNDGLTACYYFLTGNVVVLAIIFGVIIAVISVFLGKSIAEELSCSRTALFLYIIGVFCALGQNLVFLYQLLIHLYIYDHDVISFVLNSLWFVLLYIINLGITIGATYLSKKTRSISLYLQGIIGFCLAMFGFT